MGFDKAKAVRAAEKFLAQNKIPSAIEEYRRIVEHDPGDFNALNTLGDLYARVGQKAEAVACYERVAEHYRRQGFAPKAIAVYKKITRFTPDSPEVARSLAALYEQQGLVVDARAQYLLVAEGFARAGQKHDSLEALRRVADLDPNNARVRLRLAESYLAEKLHDQAAEAFIEAGARLLARQDHAGALEAFERALVLRPHNHAALHGLVAAHVALGTAGKATDALKRAVADRPDDLELYSMLASACLEAADAACADAAIRVLAECDPTSYELVFDVARLHLQRGGAAEAVGALARVAHQALAARRDAPLVEVLQEALARDPELVEALRLLSLVYTARRDDENLRATLEHLAEVFEALGDEEGEREALGRLVQLAPYEWRFHERLNALNGAESAATGDEPAQETIQAEPPAEEEVPTFESFMLSEGAGGDAAPSPPGTSEEASREVSSSAAAFGEFEWNSVGAPEPVADASASFADLNEFTDSAGGDMGAGRSREVELRAGARPFGRDFDDTGGGSRQPPDGAADSYAGAVLAQELESVDFYIEQGYAEIARDTLDILERQYGAQAPIEERRRRLAAAPSTQAVDAGTAADGAGEPASQDSSTGFEFNVPPAEAAPTASPETSPRAEAWEFAPVTADDVSTQPPSPVVATPSRADRGAASVFDELRDAFEDEGEQPTVGDFETHYNIGLAYSEMELLDQAVEEFQQAAALVAPGDGTARFLNCCNMLGHCLLSKGIPRAAAVWFRKGLQAPGHTEDEYQALRYELGTAYEQMGDIDSAIEAFTEVYAIDVSYRGVADKLRELQALKAAR